MKPENGITCIPGHMGTGYIQGYIFTDKLRMVIRQYTLKDDFLLDRGLNEGDKMVVIAFHHICRSRGGQKNDPAQTGAGPQPLPSVQVSTSGFNIELLPANKKVNAIVITVHIDYLKELLHPGTGKGLLETITSGTRPFLFEELVSPAVQDVANEMAMARPAEQLQRFYYKIKTEELVYLLFDELLKRQRAALQPLKPADVRMVYLVKEQILSDITRQPALSELVKLSGMSESKLKRLFKQVFGTSIYNYYQGFRMNEAARLIKEQGLTVSEAGYQLGFSNLSHFSRLFETHIGIKPKKYSLSK